MTNDNVLKFAPITDEGQFLLDEDDYVAVVDAEGNDLPPVPKHWGEDQLPPGAKKKGKKAKAGKGDPGPDPDAEPKGNASAEEWVEWAKRVKGAKDEDLVDEQGEALKRDALRAKFGTSAE